MTTRASLHRHLPFLSWPALDARGWRTEALAGLTVGLMVIPQGVAYAVLAGMPPITGIYASILPAIVAALFSASPRLAVGPTALTCLLAGSAVAALAPAGSAQWAQLVIWLALLSGGLQVVLGLLRTGWLLNLVSSPVLMAFTQAAALLIILSQLPAMLGVSSIAAWLQGAASVHLPTLAFGLGAIGLMMLARRFSEAFPMVLVVMAGSAWLSSATGFAAAGGATLGSLPEGLPALQWPDWPGLALMQQLVLPALTITLVSFLETASSAKVDNERAGKPWNQDQDLIGQGLGKIASALVGAFPTSSSFSRSALNLYAGARTGWATIASALVVLACLVIGLQWMQPVPKSVLAAVVIIAVMGLLRPALFARLWRVSRVEAVLALFTLAVTLWTAPNLYWGVLAGVLSGLIHFLYQRLHPRIVEIGLHPDGSLRDRNLWKLPPLAPRLFALRMDDELDFASAAALERAIIDHLVRHAEVRHVCLFAQPINRIDATGVEMFAGLRARLAAQGVTLHLSGIKLPVQTVLMRAGALAPDPWLRLYRADAEALAALAALAVEADQPAGALTIQPSSGSSVAGRP